jgi:hypothetical protein
MTGDGGVVLRRVEVTGVFAGEGGVALLCCWIRLPNAA